MKVIIMAAGFGSRIQGVIGDKPKCLIEVEGETLIGRIVTMLHQREIKDISVITGFKGELIHEELGSKVDYFHNPFFQVTNSIASLWFARDLLEGDVLLMLEALKMEIEVKAPCAGTVTAIHVRGDQNVAVGDPLVEIAP